MDTKEEIIEHLQGIEKDKRTKKYFDREWQYEVIRLLCEIRDEAKRT